ncbi:chemotaxis response regulator CheY [soil metagenome]
MALPPKTHVLVVDDNQSDRLIVRRLLEKLGFIDVQLAEDGSIAESKIENAEKINRPFQLIIIDWNMPGMNGIKLLQNIRKMKLTKTAKIIMMTATAEVDVVETAVASGVNDFIVKPVIGSILKEKLTKLFAEGS